MTRWFKQAILPLALVTVTSVLLAGCHAPQGQPLPSTPSSPPSFSTAPSSPPPEEGSLLITSTAALQEELRAAMREVRQPGEMDISDLELSDTPELDIKNLYYELLRQEPEMKYAYDLSAHVEEGLLTCRISYMPYKTGDYPLGWQGAPVSSLEELIEVAQAHMGEEPAPIRLNDTSLDPDRINNALQQVGGGYILCSLNRDGTALTYMPAPGMTLQDCLSRLEEADELVAETIRQVVCEPMAERECAEALYRHLTQTVGYDRRYYSDLESMPYDARTAIGALRDGTAICGGYSHALKLLFEQSGIPCYTVIGECRGEHHMWNIALLDGQWLWFDATADRSKSPQYKPRHFALAELGEEYVWNQVQIDRLVTLPEE